MNEEPVYSLLQAIDPSKIRVPISERFSKLTLSSNKKNRKPEVDDVEDGHPLIAPEDRRKRESASRNLLQQLSQEEEIESSSAITNPLLRSNSPIDDQCEDTHNHTESQPYTDTMDPLNVTEDETTSDNDCPLPNLDVDVLSQKISTMEIISRPISVSSTCSSSVEILNEVTQLVSTESQRSSMGEIKAHRKNLIEDVSVKKVFKKEVISITPNSKVKHCQTRNDYEMTDDDEDEDEEDEAITISDSSVSNLAEENGTQVEIGETEDSTQTQDPSQMAMSTLNQLRGTLGLSPDKMERMAVFLRDVSLEQRNLEEYGRQSLDDFEEVDIVARARRIATADTESVTPDGDDDDVEDIATKSLRERQNRLKAIDGSSENTEEQNNSKRLANEETQENSLIEHLQFSPTQNNEIIIQEEKTPLQNKAHRIASAETQNNSIIYDEEPIEKSPLSNDGNKQSPSILRKRLASAETQDNTIMSEISEPTPADETHLGGSPLTPTNYDDRKTLRNLASAETEDNTIMTDPKKNFNTPTNKDGANMPLRKIASAETIENTIMTAMSLTEYPKTIALAETEENTRMDLSISSCGEEPQPLVKKSTKNMANDETELNTSASEPDDIVNKSLHDDSILIPSSPENSTYDKQRMDNSYDSIKSPLHGDTSAPDHSITILETEDENESMTSRKSSDNNNKLSNSFQTQDKSSIYEDSDDSGSSIQHKISQIQMSMANINISAKINIKIHIPDSTETSEDEQQEEETSSDQNHQSHHTRRMTIESAPEEIHNKQQLSISRRRNFTTPSKPQHNESHDLSAKDNSVIDQNESSKSQSPPIENKEISSRSQKSLAPIDIDDDDDGGDDVDDGGNANLEFAMAQKLLNEIYGNSWQTPDVIRTLKRTSGSGGKNCSKVTNSISKISTTTTTTTTQKKEKAMTKNDSKCNSVLAEDSVLGDFSMFRRNIVKTNLDSTRLVTPKSKSKTNSIKIKSNCQTEPRNNRKQPQLDVRNEDNAQFKIPQTEIRKKNCPGTPAIAKITANQIKSQNERWRQLIDDSESDEDGNNASDDDDADNSEAEESVDDVDNKSETENKGRVSRKEPVASTKKSTTKKKFGKNKETPHASGDDSDGDQQSDTSWKIDDSLTDEDSDYEIKTKTQTGTRRRRANTTKKSNATIKPGSKKDKSQDDIVYLDLSKEEVSILEDIPASPPANHDENFASRLNDILKTCRHEDKPKLPSSAQSTKTKRKLFTPMFGDEMEGADYIAVINKIEKENKKILSEENESIILDVATCPFDSLGRPKRLEIINKQLDVVKSGKPIFQLTPSPKKTTKTPLTPRTQEKVDQTPKAKTDNKSKPTTGSTRKAEPKKLQELSSTPNYKYNFLKSLDVTVSKSFCHPDALYYRDNYRTKKEDLAHILYEMYNQKLFNNKLDVPITWNKKLLNTAGRCLNKKKLGIRSSAIELSEKVLTSADRLRCTLIHELCHAATWIFQGEGGHGRTWKEWAARANATFPEIPKIGVCHQYEIEYKYTYKCTLCAAKSYAHSKSKKVENIRCSYCHGAIEIFLNKKDKEGNIIPTPVKEPTGFAKFVKDNYKKHKGTDTKHADIMKILSNEFAALKVTKNGN